MKIRTDLANASVPIEVLHILAFIKNQNLTIHSMFQMLPNSVIDKFAVISESKFDSCCRQYNYIPKDRANLVMTLREQMGVNKFGISLYNLQQF